jgi:hypothetical protein
LYVLYSTFHSQGGAKWWVGGGGGLRVLWSAYCLVIMDSTSTFTLNNLSTDPNFDFLSSLKNSTDDDSEFFYHTL